MERFTQMSPEDTFGTTLKVCSCINRCFTISFLFFFFPRCINIFSPFEFAYVSENSSKRRPKRSLHRKRQ